MSQLTAKERFFLQSEIADEIYGIQRANDILLDIWEQYFCMREANPTKFYYDRKIIADRISGVTTLIFEQLISYAMKTGDQEIHGLRNRLDEATQAMTTLEAENMIQEARERLSSEKFKRSIIPLMEKPDSELIPAIRNVLREATV